MAKKLELELGEPDATVTVDALGRFVVPAAVRRAVLGRSGRLKLFVSSRGGRSILVLEPDEPAESAVKEIDGLLVATGDLQGEWPDASRERADRAEKLWRGR
jgi:bifunctional DNA-binding transcriptional regulator/antitoxin component of YhaV-PrlF toxin-antitoxin module